MSTFDGKVAEFPDIRIDYFRTTPNSRPPLAYFLSHVHSDHLVGLESCKSPFIYCTPGTRDILLRLEKYPHRMNFARGILETRRQTYRHLKTLLKAIPLETPTTIELAPGKEVRVTLFDANHCVGACMFLIEGGGKAVLYTGDIRSEVWWVDSLKRQPVLLPYVCPVKGELMLTLDCIYLDTTFVVTGQEDRLRDFASKAEGIDELLRKMGRYPSGTLFYFDAWTFGYEEVWRALSSFLGVGVHVDAYRHGLYLALANSAEKVKAPEAQQMIGYLCGNHFQQGCLTVQQSQVHSCEKGTGCEIWSKGFVRITPIVSRYQGVEMAELGVGGGQSDFSQRHELEVRNSEQVGELMAFCAKNFQGQPEILSGVLQLLSSVIGDDVSSIELDDFTSTAQTRMSQPDEIGYTNLDGMPLEKLVPALARVVTNMKLKKSQSTGNVEQSTAESAKRADGLPKQITFPYSRHSSYKELCLLLEAFKPDDIFPCTVDETGWNPECIMSSLFGHIYERPPSFRHDEYMLRKRGYNNQVKTVDLRPDSSGSASSEYATPDENHSRSYDASRTSERGRKRNSDAESGSRPGSMKRQKMDRQSPSTGEGRCLYVGNLAYATTERDLKTFFQGYDVVAISMPTDPNIMQESNRYAFVEVSTPSEAERAINQLYGKKLLGRTIPVQHSRRRKPDSEVGGQTNDKMKRRKPQDDFGQSSDDDRLRQETIPSTSKTTNDFDLTSWPDLTDVERADAGSPMRNRWRKLIAQSRPQQQESLNYARSASHTNLLASALVAGDDLRERHPPVQSLEFGRLSPPTTMNRTEENGRVTSVSKTAAYIPSSSILRGSSSTKSSNGLSPKAKKKLAFRREVYNAVLGIDGSSWNDIGGLVSVSGHQMKEEEL